jgi:putative membrane protein
MWALAAAMASTMLATRHAGAAEQTPGDPINTAMDERDERRTSTPAQRASGTDHAVSGSEEAVVLSAMHQVNQLEIQAGELAQQKGQSDAVRRFGERLADQHRDSDTEVLGLARKSNIQLEGMRSAAAEAPAELDRRHRATLEKLQRAQGADFDREFINAMLEGHDQTIKQLDSARAKLPGNDVRALIDKTLPVLHKHHEQAQQLKTSAGAG